MMLEVPPSWMISPYSRNLAVKLISASAQSYLSAWVSQCQSTWRVIASQQCWVTGLLWPGRCRAITVPAADDRDLGPAGAGDGTATV